MQIMPCGIAHKACADPAIGKPKTCDNLQRAPPLRGIEQKSLQGGKLIHANNAGLIP